MKKIDITKAEQVLAELNAKREELIARGHDLDERRQEIAFAAHTGSKKERILLHEINNEALTHDLEMKSLDSAITEATKRLSIADQAAAHAAEKENALALRAKVDEFLAHAVALDEAFTAMAKHATALEMTLKEIHLLGCAFPSRPQLDSLGARAMLTAIQGTPWRRDFEVIAPGQRQSFTALVGQWCDRIEANHIAPLVGDPELVG
jgi:hypothetical protein